MSHAKLLTVLALVAVLAAPPAMAQDVRDHDPIKVTLEPYVWAVTLDGTAGLGNISAPVRVTVKDFVEGFKIGGMGRVKIEQNDRFIYADAIVADYENSRFRPFFNQPLRSKVRYFDVGIGLNKSVRLSDKAVLTLSPQIGVQHVYLLSDVNGSLIVARADGSWWSPSAGLTGSLPATDRLSAVLAVNAAGFGLGKTDYQNGSAALRYRLGRHWNLSAGYRVARGSYKSTTGLSIDLDGAGPMIGIAYQFNLTE